MEYILSMAQYSSSSSPAVDANNRGALLYILLSVSFVAEGVLRAS